MQKNATLFHGRAIVRAGAGGRVGGLAAEATPNGSARGKRRRPHSRSTPPWGEARDSPQRICRGPGPKCPGASKGARPAVPWPRRRLLTPLEHGLAPHRPSLCPVHGWHPMAQAKQAKEIAKGGDGVGAEKARVPAKALRRVDDGEGGIWMLFDYADGM